jgi:hypothetical protein
MSRKSSRSHVTHFIDPQKGRPAWTACGCWSLKRATSISVHTTCRPCIREINRRAMMRLENK